MFRIIVVVIVAVLLLGMGFVFFKSDKTAENIDKSQYRTIVLGVNNDVVAEVPKQPKRVVFLTSSSLDWWLVAGGRDSVVGRTDDDTINEHIASRLNKDVEAVGMPSGVSLEKVMSLKPDLVIGSGTMTVQQQLKEPLKEAGIAFLPVSSVSMDEMFKELTLFGELTGNFDLAQQEIKRIKDIIAVEEKRRQGKEPKKVLLVFGTSTSFTVALPSSRQGDLLRLAGGVNIAEDNGLGARFIPFSLEFVVKENPDFILFITHGDKDIVKEQMRKTLSENSAWQSISAVREDRMHVLPPELFAINPGSKSDEAVIYLSNLLYPEE